MAVEIRFYDGAGGSGVKKKRIFSAPEGCTSKNDGRFLRRRVACQETVARFLRRRVACQKTMAVFCAAGLHVKNSLTV